MVGWGQGLIDLNLFSFQMTEIVILFNLVALSFFVLPLRLLLLLFFLIAKVRMFDVHIDISYNVVQAQLTVSFHAQWMFLNAVLSMYVFI